MKKEKIIIVSLITILCTVVLIILTKNYITYRNVNHITKNPFNTIEVVGQKVRLKDNLKTYEVEVDCSKLEENEQILYYRLNEDYKDFKISVSTIVFKNKKVIETNIKEATSMETNISVFDENEKYEQVYHIKTICENAEESAEEEEENNQNESNVSTKKQKK